MKCDWCGTELSVVMYAWDHLVLCQRDYEVKKEGGTLCLKCNDTGVQKVPNPIAIGTFIGDLPDHGHTAHAPCDCSIGQRFDKRFKESLKEVSERFEKKGGL